MQMGAHPPWQARTDPNFKPVSTVAMQTFCNPVAAEGALPDHDQVVRAASEMPTHASKVACSDGYKAHAMLFVDEEFSQCRIQRESRLGVLSFRPVVRFCSTHYRYVPNNNNAAETGSHRLVQVGIGEDDHLGGLGFRQPPPPAATVGVAHA